MTEDQLVKAIKSLEVVDSEESDDGTQSHFGRLDSKETTEDQKIHQIR